MQLVPNDDPNEDCYEIFPRSGSFELSTVAEDKNRSSDILFYSKLIAKMWPHYGLVSKQLASYWEEKSKGKMSPEELKGRFSFKEETVLKVQKRIRRDRSFETIGRSTMGRSFG